MHNNIFIRSILDFYLYILGNYNFIAVKPPLVFKSCKIISYDIIAMGVIKLCMLESFDMLSLLVIKSCIVVNLVIISMFFIVADYYDLKFGIIPNKLSFCLLIYGLIFNLSLALFTKSISIFLLSMLLTAFIAIFGFVLWYIGFWGGGDLKFFIGLSLSLSFLDLNCFNFLNVDFLMDSNSFILKSAIDYLNLPIFNQFIFYPKVFSILFNGILISFLSLLVILMYSILKNKQLKYYSILSVLDFKLFFNQLTTRSIHVNDLSEGMVLDKYYFKNKKIFHMIEDLENSNLIAMESENDYCFASLNRIGLTEDDIELIGYLYEKDLIGNPNFQIKKGIPFMPFLTLGYVGFLLFGDFISIISSLLKFSF